MSIAGVLGVLGGVAKAVQTAASKSNGTSQNNTPSTQRTTTQTANTQTVSKPVTVQPTANKSTSSSGSGSATGPYNANTNFANEEKYLNSLISAGGGNANWAKQQLQILNNAKAVYGGNTNSRVGSQVNSNPVNSISTGGSAANNGSSGNSNGYQAKVYTPNGGVQYGTIINGVTYMPDGSRPTAGSTVEDAYGRLWTVPANSSNQSNGQQGTQVRIFDGLGNVSYGTIINGTTYMPDGSAVPSGYVVEDASGRLWKKTPVGGVEISKADAVAAWEQANAMPTDLSEQIIEMYQKAEQQALLQQQLATQQAIAEQQKLLKGKEEEYNKLREDNNIQSLQAQDNLALRAAQLGDNGGIGQAQYSAVMNAADQRLFEINLEQKQLEQEVEQNVAALRAQGDYEAANLALQIGQAKIQALIDEAKRIDETKLNQFNIDREYALSVQEMQIQNALTKLQLGLFSEADAVALGISAAEAKSFADRINLLAQLDLDEAKLALKKAANSVGIDYNTNLSTGASLSGIYNGTSGGSGGSSGGSKSSGGNSGGSSGDGNSGSVSTTTTSGNTNPSSAANVIQSSYYQIYANKLYNNTDDAIKDLDAAVKAGKLSEIQASVILAKVSKQVEANKQETKVNNLNNKYDRLHV